MGDADRDFWNDAYRVAPDQAEVIDRILDAELEGLPVGTALDLGCGAGTNALKLAQRGWSVVGVDWAEHAVELAARSAQEKGLDTEFYVGDITTWEPPAKFDLVISTYALPGGEDSERVLRTAVQAVAEGGTLMVAEWDASMAEVWSFDAEDLMTVEGIVALLPDLVIEKAEVRHVPDMFADADDPRGHAGAAANVAFVRAKKT